MRKIFLPLFCLLLSYASAQKVGIGTASPQALFHVADSAVLFSAPFGLPSSPSNPPVSGAGTRMMWYPQKAAFRVGRVDNNQWDKDNIGYSSTSIGFNTSAIGSASTSMGSYATASGDYSTSMGFGTIASGDYSISMGEGTVASGVHSISMGSSTTASGFISTSMGLFTTASGDYSTSLGSNTTATGDYSTSLGSFTTAGGEYSTSLGNNTTARGFSSTSMGEETVASGSYSTSMGRITTASGFSSTSMGEGSVARARGSVALGMYNDSIASSDRTSIVATDPLFIIGNGTSSSIRSNAMTMLKNGHTGFNTISPDARVHIVKSTASGGLFNSSASLILDEENGSILQFLNNSVYQSGILSGTEKTAIRSGILFPGDSSITFRSGGNNTRMTLEANGNVGIGTTAPSEKLHVIGNILASGTYTGTSFNVVSDFRLKENIKALDNPIAKIKAIRGVTYQYKSSSFPDKSLPNTPQVGVIAQEVETVLPEVVTTDEKGYKAVDYSKIVPLLIESIKEQQKMLELQKQLLDKQQKEIEDLKKAVKKN